MSPAARAAAQAKARATGQPVAPSPAPAVTDQLGPGAGLDPEAPVVGSPEPPPTSDRHHRLAAAARKTTPAGRAAQLIAATRRAAPGPASVGPVSGHVGAPRPDGPVDQILLQLAADRRRLKEIKSIAAKVDLKRELVPTYDGWIAGLLKARADGGPYVQDEVLVTLLCWSIDTGDFDRALPLVEYALDGGLVLPEHMKRDVATFVVEETADQALTAFKAGGDAAAAFPRDILGRVEALTADLDMHDPVRAKLKRAIGEAIETTIPADAAEGDVRGLKAAALDHYLKARALYAGIGVAKAVERLERDLKKTAATTEQSSDDAAQTQQQPAGSNEPTG